MTVSMQAKRWLFCLSAVMVVIASQGGTAQTTPAVKPGDILVGNNVANTIVSIDPSTGAQTIVSSGGTLCTPEGLAVDSGGRIVVASACSNEILSIDPSTGTQSVISSGGSLSYPVGLGIEANGNIIVANYTGNTIVRVDASTGAQTVVSAGGQLDYPTDLVVGSGGDIFVTSQIANTILRIDPSSGAQSLVSAGGSLVNPAAIVIDAAGHLLVGNAGANNILRIDPATGSQTVVSSGGTFDYPSGIGRDASGSLFVANYLGNTVVRVDPATGAQSPVSAGGLLYYPTRMTVVGPLAPRPVVLTFDDVPNNALIGSGYGSFGWDFGSGWNLQDDWSYTYWNGAGNSYGSPSGEYAASNGYNTLTLIRYVESAPGSCCVRQAFDFVGAWFSSATTRDALTENSANAITLDGYRAGVLVRSIDQPLGPGYVWVQADFVNIDELRLRPRRDTGFGWASGFLMDDFTFIAPSAGTPNAAPTANAGANQTVRLGATVRLDGSGSSDDNTATNQLRYAWSFVSMPSGSQVALAGATTMTPSFVPDLPGTYVVQLVATDLEGLSSAPSQVTISDNPPPTADAGLDQLVIVGSTVQLHGSAVDPNGETVSYGWALTTVPAGSVASIASPTVPNATFTADVPGVYVATLTASDALGAGAPDTVQITATTTWDYAAIQVQAASMVVNALPSTVVSTRGNQNALTQFFSNAVLALQGENLTEAAHQLRQAIQRTDGCALRGTPDGNGPGRDWITTCQAQKTVYDSLLQALGAVAP